MKPNVAHNRIFSSKKPIVFCCEGVGLANRLRALIGYRAISYALDVPFSLYWAADPACNVLFADLFEVSDFTILTANQADEVASRGDSIVYDRTAWFFPAIWQRYAKGQMPLGKFVEGVKRSIEKLQPTKHIRDIVMNFVKTNILEKQLGIHIRYTDNLMEYKRWSRNKHFNPHHISQISGFVTAIDRRSTQQFFLATDNRDVEEYLFQRYGKDMITFSKHYNPVVDSNSIRTSSIDEAVIEMFLLGSCQTLIGTYHSSFSKLSAILGGPRYSEIRGNSCVRLQAIDHMQRVLGSYKGPVWSRIILWLIWCINSGNQ